MNPLIYWGILLVMSILSAADMVSDKRAARKKRWRISERTLFLGAILGGACGGTIAMFAVRHKTKHWYFRTFFPLLAVLQLAGGFYLTLKEYEIHF